MVVVRLPLEGELSPRVTEEVESKSYYSVKAIYPYFANSLKRASYDARFIVLKAVTDRFCFM